MSVDNVRIESRSRASGSLAPEKTSRVQQLIDCGRCWGNSNFGSEGWGFESLRARFPDSGNFDK